MSKFTINIKNFIKSLVYDKDETDTLLAGKSDVGHNHGDLYYTESEVDTLLNDKADVDDVPTATSDLTNDSDFITSSDIVGKQEKSNIVTSTSGWNATLSDEKYPSEKLVKDSLDEKISKSNTVGLVKNDGTIDTTQYISEHQSLANYIQKSSTTGLVKNDGTIDTNQYLTEHQSLDGKTVTVEKQTTAESGYVATYVVKQGGSQVGSKINIPKDYLVKSATLETCEEDDVPVVGYEVGDKYLDFVINTKDSSGTDEHLYILVSDLIDTYTADESSLTLGSGNVFSIKAGGVGSTELASNAVTTAKITDANVTRAKLASAVTDELDSKLEASDIDVDFNQTTGVLTIAVGESASNS